MSRYPIKVSYDDKTIALDLATCEACKTERTLDPADGCPYDRCLRCECGGQIVWKYDPVDACPSCGKLGYEACSVGGACSRKCQLQAEYAASLKAGEAA